MKENKKKEYFSLKEVNSIWRTVLHKGKKKIIPKGEMLDLSSSAKDTLMFLDKGIISLRNLNPQGRLRISLYMESGCILGEVPILSKVRDSNRINFYQTQEECTVYILPPELLTDCNFIKEHPELIQNLLESLANKIRYFHSLVADKNGESAIEVICRYINRLAEKNHADIFNPHMSQSEFALSLGMHRSTVCRIIKELRSEGVIGVFEKNKLEILDRSKLKKIAFNM